MSFTLKKSIKILKRRKEFLNNKIKIQKGSNEALTFDRNEKTAIETIIEFLETSLDKDEIV